MTPTLILLPGLDGTGRMFEPLLTELGGALPCQVLAYPPTPATVDDHIAMAWEALPRDRDYVLLGESYSGPIAVELAALRPAGLVGLVMSTSFLTCPNWWLTVLRPVLAMMPSVRVPTGLASRVLLGPDAPWSLKLLLAQTLQSVPTRTLVDRLAAIATVDVRDAARRVNVPTLVLAANQDMLVPASAIEEIAAGIAGSTVERFDAPHLLLQVRAAEVAQLLLRRLRPH